ncbi:hypothetical protein HYX13_03440 [Candidatus Woesearchaeota archaeon]|nr:hypothetical protein [Candidatus Woesearchaeota archaeon]
MNDGCSYYCKKHDTTPFSRPHEAREKNIPEDNCTTVIPWFYLFLEQFNFSTQIIQFVNFRTILEGDKEKGKEKPPTGSHFALLVETGRKHPYLLDPFHDLCNPILEKKEYSLRFGKNGERASGIRTYESCISYSPEEFAAMMNRLHEPAASLDMLVAGQKVFSKREVQKVDCDLMLYYLEQSKTVLTRLYIPQQGIQQKAIYCSQSFNEKGVSTQTKYRLVYAKKAYWTSLEDEKVIAELEISKAKEIKKIRQKIAQEHKGERLGILLHRQQKQQKETLFDLVHELWEELTVQDQEKIRPAVLARTLYECTKPRKEYLFSEEEHDQHLHEIIKKEMELSTSLKPHEDAFYLHGWKLEKLPRNEYLHRKRIVKKIKKEKQDLVEEIDALNFSRKLKKDAYISARDKALFAKTLEGKTVEQLEAEVRRQNLPFLLGYAAMVTDFFPFLFEARDDLELRLFQPSLREKFLARYSHNS